MLNIIKNQIKTTHPPLRGPPSLSREGSISLYFEVKSLIFDYEKLR